jgi:predicted ATP-dependent protease
MAPQLRRLDRSAAQLLAELDRQLMMAIINPRLEELKRDYQDETQVAEFIDDLGTDMLARINDFARPKRRSSLCCRPPAMPRDGVFERYKVNVIVTHGKDAAAPVVFADSPSYYHMFGRIDYRSSFGSMVTDHTMIKPGELHRANGGFIVVQALDLLTAPLVWETLKRALRTRQLRLENIGEQFSIIPTAWLSPEPIPLQVKVAMIGTSRVFQIADGRRGVPCCAQGKGRLQHGVTA